MRIVHLYADELNLYGDMGNVLCLEYRLKNRGFRTKISNVGIGDKVPEFDIMFIGGGQDKEISIIENDVRRKSDSISYAVQSGKTILAVCAGFQLLGEYYKTADEKIITLSGCLPFHTVATCKRRIGNIVTETEYGRLVGYENHSGNTFLERDLKPLGKVIYGFGNNTEDNYEGVEYKNTFGTYLHGPLLPKNPDFADEIIFRAVPDAQYISLDDELERKCHNELLCRFK